MSALVIVVGVSLPLLFATFWIALHHRWALLAPFILVVGFLMVTLHIAGLHPLAFFVSAAGWLFFFGLACIAAAIVRLLENAWTAYTSN